MPKHDYSPETALNILLKKIGERDQTLAAHIQTAIDAGKDTAGVEPSSDKRKKPRVYRKKAPYTAEEALILAIEALQAYFIEQPLFAVSANSDFRAAAIGTPKAYSSRWARTAAALENKSEPVDLSGIAEDKQLSIEIQTETQLSKATEEIVSLSAVSLEKIEMQKRHLSALRTLVTFD